MARGGQRAGALQQACEAHAAPALARVEAAGAVERGHERVAALKLFQREPQRAGDQHAQLEAIGVVFQRPGAVRDPGGRGEGVAGERVGLVGAREAAPRAAQAEQSRRRALHFPDEIGPGGECGAADELPPPGQVPAPERLCAQDRMHCDRDREHQPQREVPAEQVVAARGELEPARPAQSGEQRRRDQGESAGTGRGAAVPARRLRQAPPDPAQLPAQHAGKRESADAVRAEDPGIAMPAGEEGHRPGGEQEPDEQCQAPVGRARGHDSESVRPHPGAPWVPSTLRRVRGPLFLALLLAALAAAGGCDLGSDGEDGSGGGAPPPRGRGGPPGAAPPPPAARPRPGTNTIVVSHGFAIGDATGQSLAEGEAVIVAPGRGARGFEIVSRVEAERWARLGRGARPGRAARPPRVRLREFKVFDGAGPHDVAPAADGAVWFTAQAAGELGRLNPRTGRVRRVPLGAGSAPHGVIVGPDGAAWVTGGGLNAIVRVDGRSLRVRRFPLPADRAGANLNTATFDRSGRLWFTGQTGVYGRLDPRTGRMRVFDAPRGPGPYGISTTPEGNVWYASLAGSHIARIDTRTGRV